MKFKTAHRLFRRWLAGAAPLVFGQYVPDLLEDVQPDAIVTLIIQVPTELGGRTLVVGHLPVLDASAIVLALNSKGVEARFKGEGFVASVAQVVKVRARRPQRRKPELKIIKERAGK
jgi:phosphohistidine phosphatase SixA